LIISIDVATGNLLDLEELTHVAVVLETNGNEEFKVDNHTAPDNNNTVWVRLKLSINRLTLHLE
jgi:hypothetical protein